MPSNDPQNPPVVSPAAVVMPKIQLPTPGHGPTLGELATHAPSAVPTNAAIATPVPPTGETPIAPTPVLPTRPPSRAGWLVILILLVLLGFGLYLLVSQTITLR